MISRRSFLNNVIGTIAGTAVLASSKCGLGPSVSNVAPQPGSRADHVMQAFEQEPAKGVALARTFMKTDPNWPVTKEFIELACGPFGGFVCSASDDVFNAYKRYV